MPFFKNILITLLTLEARLILWKYHPKMIVVTGSVGKTGTKDAIYQVVATKASARKAVKGYNDELGVPLTIIGAESGWNNPFKWLAVLYRGAVVIVMRKQYPEWLVLELGADRPGDISRAAAWLRPDIAVITAVPKVPVHVEYFASPEDVLREKLSIISHLRHDGKLVFNADDPQLDKELTQHRGLAVSFGFTTKASYRASHYDISYHDHVPVGIHFRAERENVSLPVTMLGALGKPRVYAALAALAVGGVIGVDISTAARSLEVCTLAPGRMRIVPGKNGSIIIDDSYNSSPAATLAALETLTHIRTTGRRIAVMGDMLELGKYSAEAHREAGVHAAQVANLLITVGFRARAMGTAALDAGLTDTQVRAYELHEAARAGTELAQELQAGDVVLVKGSQGVRMERAVEALMAEPARAAEFLARQDSQWRARA